MVSFRWSLTDGHPQMSSIDGHLYMAIYEWSPAAGHLASSRYIPERSSTLISTQRIREMLNLMKLSSSKETTTTVDI